MGTASTTTRTLTGAAPRQSIPDGRHAPMGAIRAGDVARKALGDVTARECHWPVGDPFTKDFGFCALPADAGQHYCRAHSIRASRTVQA
jgi:hypothetical protein